LHGGSFEFFDIGSAGTGGWNPGAVGLLEEVVVELDDDILSKPS
jgi:hypothetical protein